MSKFLVIAEKPSVAQSYAKNLSAYKREDGYLEGESCIVSWCLGHLAEYAQPEEYDPKYEKWQFDDLPILPEAWKLKVSKDKKKQFDVLKGLMNRSDVEYLVNGCDAGREGELIFQRVYVLAGCRKPVKRLWISSMEDAAIQKGFQTMKSEEEYKNLCMAAVCRAQADWLIGMNGTRAYTTRYFKRLVVGRVQTPTLAMLAERQERIEHFQKEAFYKVALTDAEGVVDRESYLRNKKELNEKIEKVQTKYEQIQAVTTAEDDLMKDVKTVEKNAEEVNILKRMTRNIAEIFVEEITIYDSEKIEVKFVFDDLLVDMANRIEKKKEGIA